MIKSIQYGLMCVFLFLGAVHAEDVCGTITGENNVNGFPIIRVENKNYIFAPLEPMCECDIKNEIKSAKTILNDIENIDQTICFENVRIIQIDKENQKEYHYAEIGNFIISNLYDSSFVYLNHR